MLIAGVLAQAQAGQGWQLGVQPLQPLDGFIELSAARYCRTRAHGTILSTRPLPRGTRNDREVSRFSLQRLRGWGLVGDSSIASLSQGVVVDRDQPVEEALHRRPLLLVQRLDQRFDPLDHRHDMAVGQVG